MNALLCGAPWYMKEHHLGLLPEIVGNNWPVQLPHRPEYTCTEQVTVHTKQNHREQFTDRVRVLREEQLQPEWKSISINIHINSFGGKCTDFAREKNKTAPFGAHHLHSSENLWAGLILPGLCKSNHPWPLFSSAGRAGAPLPRCCLHPWYNLWPGVL